jgi:hypothetical protein
MTSFTLAEMGDSRQQTPPESPISGSSDSTTVRGSNSPPDTPNPQDSSDSASSVSGGSLSNNPQPIPKPPLAGWPQLAELMASTPDFAAFPRFRDLNIKSLLYYQVQLGLLKKKLHEQEFHDNENGEGTDEGLFAERADVLVEEEESEQFRLIRKIREVLKEYSRCSAGEKISIANLD